MPDRPSAQSVASLPPLKRAISIMQILRSPNGCPWDREQTLHSLQRYTLEEVYEVFDAIDRKDWVDLRDELGDLLLQVLFYAQIAADAGEFNIEDVAAGLSEKLLRRHPHVFGSETATSAAAVITTWERVKRQERDATRRGGEGILDNVPRAMSALLEANRLSSRAAKVGFDWTELEGVLSKVREELHELELEIAAADQKRVEEELGDLLFSAVNLARHLGVDAEQSLRGASARFRDRFKTMEKSLGDQRVAEGPSPEEWEQAWARAKAATEQYER